MGDWQDDIQNELRSGHNLTHPGQKRAAARRIAGMALQELDKNSSRGPSNENYLQTLQRAMTEGDLPETVRDAAQRLQARLSADFESPSIDPLGDALIIVEYVKNVLGE